MNCKFCKADCCSRGLNRDAAFCAGWIKMTNADRIRAISDEELAIILAEGCHNTRECPTICAPIYPFDEVVESCAKCWLEWLKQEVDE